MQYYVDVHAAFGGDGSKNSPFQKIQQAADLARPGDEVLVAPGIYREYVNPKNAGTSEQRITYRSIEPLKAIITGAEPVKNWEKAEGTVWTARVSNEVFGDYNPRKSHCAHGLSKQFLLPFPSFSPALRQ